MVESPLVSDSTESRTKLHFIESFPKLTNPSPNHTTNIFNISIWRCLKAPCVQLPPQFQQANKPYFESMHFPSNVYK